MIDPPAKYNNFVKRVRFDIDGEVRKASYKNVEKLNLKTSVWGHSETYNINI